MQMLKLWHSLQPKALVKRESLGSPIFTDLHLTVTTWNINGWTLTNYLLRTELRKSILPDVICLCETHLHSQTTINIDGYTSFLHQNILTGVQVGLQF